MRSKAVSVVCAVLVILGLGVAPAQAYSPESGVKFNRPIGTKSARHALITHVNRTIDSTPAGQTIMLGIYSLDRKNTADKLIAAHRRGVNVRIVLNGHYPNTQTERLERVLGHSLAGRSFIRMCHAGCRGRKGPMHLKIFLFTKAGASRNVVMVGSGNLTFAAAVKQWNDLVTVSGSARLFALYARVFDEAARKIRVANPYLVRRVGNYFNEFFPRPGITAATDPILRPLRSIKCTGANGGAGRNGRTVIRIMNSSWREDRGVAIAESIRAKANAGCKVSVLYGRSSPRVTRLLRYHRNITLRGTAYDRDNDGEADLFVHSKYMAVSGVVGSDRSAWVTWSGTSNWSNDGLRGDEQILRVTGRGVHNRYVANFNDVTRSRSYPYFLTARVTGVDVGELRFSED